MAQMRFEPANYDAAVQQVSHYISRSYSKNKLNSFSQIFLNNILEGNFFKFKNLILGLVGFMTSTFVGYLKPNPFLCK